jgi:transposase
VGYPYESFGDNRVALIVDLESAVVHEPRPGAFDHPPSWEHLEAMIVDLVHHLDGDVVGTRPVLDGYFDAFSPAERDSITAVAMDMWEPYINSVKEHLSSAEDKIVFDRFHIMKHMGEAVDTVRKGEHRELRAEGIETLAGSKYLWLYAEKNLPDKHKSRFQDLKKLNLRTGRAWAIKEPLSALWRYHRLGWALTFYKQWFFWATHSRLKPVIDVAYMIKRHLYGILNYFSAARITNATAEGLNSKIQTIKKMAYGFRNREHFKTAIFFHCGGLQLYPGTHGEPG